MPNTNLQNQIDFNGQKFHVGLDVHKKSWAVTVRSLGIQVAPQRLKYFNNFGLPIEVVKP